MSGLRLGECLALRADNLEVRHCQYLVTETTRAGRVGPPKSGRRLVDLDATLVTKLEDHLKRMRQEAFAQGRLPGGYLFPGITQRLVKRAMEGACLADGLRRRNPHDLRHNYATLLLMDHYSPAYVQRQLGHSSITITVDTYGHWLPGEGKKDLVQTLRSPRSSVPGPQASGAPLREEAKPGRMLAVVNGGSTGEEAYRQVKKKGVILKITPS